MNSTATNPPHPTDNNGCPRCNGTEVFARGHRRGPDEYKCLSCGNRWDGPESGAPVLIGPPIILGSDANNVPTPGGIPADVADPMGFIYVPDGET